MLQHHSYFKALESASRIQMGSCDSVTTFFEPPELSMGHGALDARTSFRFGLSFHPPDDRGKIFLARGRGF
jgi:hypothetical protein